MENFFYDQKEAGVGNYFWDSLLADIESLVIYAGIHNKKYGFHRMFAKRFFTMKSRMKLHILSPYCRCAGILHGLEKKPITVSEHHNSPNYL